MGEIADMLLDGTLCETCGVALNGDGCGVPRNCINCDPKEESKQRRAKNRRRGADILAEHGVQFESKALGAHLIVRHGRSVVNYWPGTGYFRSIRGGTGRGVFSLLRALRVELKPEYRDER